MAPLHIERHRLAGARFCESPNCGEPIEPVFIVMHFTGTFEAGEAIAHLCNPVCPKPVSAHVVLDLDGTATQLVPFDVKAWHAGQSSYVTAARTYTGLNAWSIGIEVVNPGWFIKTEIGYLHEGLRLADPAQLARFPHILEAVHPDGRTVWWTGFPEAQMAALQELVRALLEAYPRIRYIVGHQDIAPGRKDDPGPAFPMPRFQRLLAGRAP